MAAGQTENSFLRNNLNARLAGGEVPDILQILVGESDVSI